MVLVVMVALVVMVPKLLAAPSEIQQPLLALKPELGGPGPTWKSRILMSKSARLFRSLRKTCGPTTT